MRTLVVIIALAGSPGLAQEVSERLTLQQSERRR
jgi:hypothetical protein